MAVDLVALASVVSSGAVAAGSLVLTYRGQKKQREHDADQAYEARAWDAKSTALYEVIAATRALTIVLEDETELAPARLVSVVPGTIERLEAQAGAVESYSDRSCRDAFIKVRKMLDGNRIDVLKMIHLEESRRLKVEAIDKQDFDAAARLRTSEKRLTEEAYEAMRNTGPELVAVCEALIEAARANMRRSTSV